MASQHYTFDTNYMRYKCMRYDHNTSQWMFQEWMPEGWQQPLPSPPPVETPMATTSPSYGNPITSPRYAIQDPTRPRTDSMFHGGYSGHNVASSPASPHSTQASHTPYGRGQHAQYAQSLYGPPQMHQQPTATYAQPTQQPNYTPVNSFPPGMPKGKGGKVLGTYNTANPIYYEKVDHSYYVRDRGFFFEGRVFSVIMNETAGENATATPTVTDYNSSKSINAVKYKDNFVHTNVRRFVVVRRRREFCFACPIFTYSGRATTKRGVRPSEHGIAYSWGSSPRLLPGEGGITKTSIPVVMAAGEAHLHEASRIYYGIHHPIQYNVKVKEIGYVPPKLVGTLIANWKAEDEQESGQPAAVTTRADTVEEEEDEEDEDDEGGENDGDGGDDDDEEDNDGDPSNSGNQYSSGGNDDGSMDQLTNDMANADLYENPS